MRNVQIKGMYFKENNKSIPEPILVALHVSSRLTGNMSTAQNVIWWHICLKDQRVMI